MCLSTGTDGGGHGVVDDDIAGHVQVGDALIQPSFRQKRSKVFLNDDLW